MISSAVQAFFEMMKQLFKMREVDIKNKPTTEIVKDKKLLKKGSDYAEKIIDLIDNYEHLLDKKDLRRYRTLKTKFKKYN